MIESKLLVGRYIKWSDPPARKVSKDTVGIWQQYFSEILSVMESTGVFTKTSQLQSGIHPKKHRTFQWLTYIPGEITFCQLIPGAQGFDVLTGPMSGCWITVFKRSGELYVAHVGTDIALGTEKNEAIKDSWNDFAKDNPDEVVKGFNPVTAWVGALPKSDQKTEDPRPTVWGLVTATAPYDLYTLILFQQKSDRTLVRIAGIQKVNSATLEQLKNLPAPRS
jgi:hypothetical protein